MTQTFTFKEIENIVKDIRDIPVYESIAEIKVTTVKKKKIKKFPFNMNMNIISCIAFTEMRQLVEQWFCMVKGI